MTLIDTFSRIAKFSEALGIREPVIYIKVVEDGMFNMTVDGGLNVHVCESGNDLDTLARRVIGVLERRVHAKLKDAKSLVEKYERAFE